MAVSLQKPLQKQFDQFDQLDRHRTLNKDKETKLHDLIKIYDKENTQVQMLKTIKIKRNGEHNQEKSKGEILKNKTNISEATTKKIPTRKVSFKTKSLRNPHRSGKTTSYVVSVQSNKVAQLTKKFNEMVNDSIVEVEENEEGDNKPTKQPTNFPPKKPTIKTKPKIEIKQKLDTGQSKLVLNNMKIEQTGSSLSGSSTGSSGPVFKTVKRKPSLKRKSSFKATKVFEPSVRSAIEIFETTDMKPRVPEKNLNVIKVKNNIKALRVYLKDSEEKGKEKEKSKHTALYLARVENNQIKLKKSSEKRDKIQSKESEVREVQLKNVVDIDISEECKSEESKVEGVKEAEDKEKPKLADKADFVKLRSNGSSLFKIKQQLLSNENNEKQAIKKMEKKSFQNKVKIEEIVKCNEPQNNEHQEKPKTLEKVITTSKNEDYSSLYKIKQHLLTRQSKEAVTKGKKHGKCMEENLRKETKIEKEASRSEKMKFFEEMITTNTEGETNENKQQRILGTNIKNVQITNENKEKKESIPETQHENKSTLFKIKQQLLNKNEVDVNKEGKKNEKEVTKIDSNKEDITVEEQLKSDEMNDDDKVEYRKVYVKNLPHPKAKLPEKVVSENNIPQKVTLNMANIRNKFEQFEQKRPDPKPPSPVKPNNSFLWKIKKQLQHSGEQIYETINQSTPNISELTQSTQLPNLSKRYSIKSQISKESLSKIEETLKRSISKESFFKSPAANKLTISADREVYNSIVSRTDAILEKFTKQPVDDGLYELIEPPKETYEMRSKLIEKSERTEPRLVNKYKSMPEIKMAGLCLESGTMDVNRRASEYLLRNDLVECRNFNVKTPTGLVNSTGNIQEVDEESESKEGYYDIYESENIYEQLPIRDHLEHTKHSEAKENIYELIPARTTRRSVQEPLPPKPVECSSNHATLSNRSSSGSVESEIYSSIKNEPLETVVSNCYETIYNSGEAKKAGGHGDYDAVRLRTHKTGRSSAYSESNCNSIISSDRRTNSIYGMAAWPAPSLAGSDSTSCTYRPESEASERSDEWVDVSDNEGTASNEFILIRHRPKQKKTPGWSKKLRDHFDKVKVSHRKSADDTDSDHHYESLYVNHHPPLANTEAPEDSDSFDSDWDSDCEYRAPQHDSGVDISTKTLPEPPPNVTNGLTKLATSATKHIRRLRRNWSLTKNDISKSLSRITKKKGDGCSGGVGTGAVSSEYVNEPAPKPRRQTIVIPPNSLDLSRLPYNDVAPSPSESNDKRRKYWSLTKFKRSLSMSSEGVQTDNGPKSTFYLDPRDAGIVEEIKSLKTGQKEVKPMSERPQIPPPLPPLEKKSSPKPPSVWYDDSTRSDSTTPTNKPQTFWYAEVGLYKKPNESSSSTGVSSTGENSGDSFSSASTMPYSANSRRALSSGGRDATLTRDSSLKESCVKEENGRNTAITDDENYYNLRNEQKSEEIQNEDENYTNVMQRRLLYEPLYQFYNAAVLESGLRDINSSDSSWCEEDDYLDDYDRVSQLTCSERPPSSRPTALELVNPIRGRSLWCEVPEVVNSAILSSLSSHQKKLQEAKFELITSEASYVNSLNVLCYHFMQELKQDHILTKKEQQHLFGNIDEVRKCSEELLADLEACWQDNILLTGICDVIQRHAEKNFVPYVTYCENQLYSERTLKHLKERKGTFMDVLARLELSPKCQLLPLSSFLMLPMQRITRLPLLADAILKRLNEADEEFKDCRLALATLNKVVKECNEGARRVERQDEFERTWKLLDFKDLPKPPTANRWLVRSGELIQLISRGDDVKLTFGKKFQKVQIHFFLFTDLLVVTKRKSDDAFNVLHYCQRSFVEVNSGDHQSLPVKDAAGKHLLFLTLLENHEGKTVEMMINCSSESDRQRWFEALSPPVSEDPNEVLYESWNCPQVAAMHEYVPQQPDELPLRPGDVVNVDKKMTDGWYHGERIQDGRTGWFPGNHVTEIASEHVRARNLRQRYRLLALSGCYLEAQKKK